MIAVEEESCGERMQHCNGGGRKEKGERSPVIVVEEEGRKVRGDSVEEEE